MGLVQRGFSFSWSVGAGGVAAVCLGLVQWSWGVLRRVRTGLDVQEAIVYIAGPKPLGRSGCGG